MSCEKGRSLLEFKKQQWAKEREELARMGEIFSHSSQKYERTSIRTFYSNLDISQRNGIHNGDYIDRGNHRSSYELMNDEDYPTNTKFYDLPDISKQPMRSPSLPAIRHKNYSVTNHINKSHQDEDTSGYTSDSGNNPHSPDIWYSENGQLRQGLSKDCKSYRNYDRLVREQQRQPQPKREVVDGKINCDNMRDRVLKTTVNDLGVTNGHRINNDFQSNYYHAPRSPSNISRDISTSSTYPVHSGTLDYTSSQRVNDERAKWNNWRRDFDYSSNSNYKNAGPGWLSRGLHDLKDSEDDNNSVNSVSHLRGQNIPLDPVVLAERVTKRRKAIEFQNAIKQQLEERERLRQWELERRIEEERLEEERLMRQRQIEQDRLEYEQQLQLEKEEAHRKKEETMLIAIAKAEEAAKMEKMKRKKNKTPVIETFDNNVKIDKVEEENKQTSNYKSTEEKTADNDFSRKENSNNVEEKILIGTPINLKKSYKTGSEGSSTNVTVKPEMEVESIALVLQPTTLIPLPVTTDVFGLQNSIGNLQVAAYIMQQQQLMNHVNENLSIINANQAERKEGDLSEQGELKHITSLDERKPLVTQNKQTSPNQSEHKLNEIESMCRLCGKCHYPNFGKQAGLILDDDVSSTRITEIVESQSILNGGNVNEGEVTKKDKQLVLRDTNLSKDKINDLQDASTQTESPTVCELCLFHKNFYKVSLKKEVSTTTTTSKQKPAAAELPVEDRDSEMTTTTTTTTTTMYRAKTKHKTRAEKLDERPKWGVNRPIVQYVKASERDPFYLRNKKRKPSKAARSLSVDSKSVSEEEVVIKARNVCTEILPIKTDEKGRVYLNFREASTIMNEDEITEKLREKYFNFGKILEKRNSELPNNSKELVRRASNPDIEIDMG